MIYRDNEVKFRIFGEHNPTHQSVYSIGDGHFTVKAFCVSPGQDPEGKLSAKAYPITNGSLTFSLGRHGTEYTANWFNYRIDTEHSTFGHKAGVLNFAMIGTLELELKNSEANTTTTYTFSNIALAQGHTGGRNNWWFGSRDGKDASAELTQITCTGVDPSKNSYDFIFKRGGAGAPRAQDVNEVEITVPEELE